MFLSLLNDFINDSYSGKRVKKNGTRISRNTIQNYEYFKNVMDKFMAQSSFELKLYLVENLTQNEKDKAKLYYRKFYEALTNFMHKKLEHYDNYVGLRVKCMRSFFNYLIDDRNLGLGTFHKHFYVPIEEIPIIALSQEQLHYIIYDDVFQEDVSLHKLDLIKDLFVFGCTVVLRVSDLLALTKKNIFVQNDATYLQVKSQKTGVKTFIKLPDYASTIVNKYKRRGQRLFPTLTQAHFNRRLKLMAALIPDNFELIKIRERKGKQVVIYKDGKKKIHFKLNEHITTHTMRRTAITTMLCLGMPDYDNDHS